MPEGSLGVPKDSLGARRGERIVENMLQTQERFIKIAQLSQLQDDCLKVARRQVDKETDFPINSYSYIYMFNVQRSTIK